MGRIEESDYDFTPVHEKRKSVEGRKELYRNGNSLKGYFRKNGISVPMSERRFVAWDGEGVTKFKKHYYVLFGSSDGNYITSKDLGTEECLELITETADRNAIHFGFAFSYDVNMILRDLSQNHLKILRKRNRVLWSKWRIEYLPRKWFIVTNRRSKKTVKIWDTWSFFMTSFVKACIEYGVDLSDIVTQGKDKRSEFSFAKIETEILIYWKAENAKAIELMEKLRTSLHSAELYISQWHGPGAIATYSMQKHKVQKSMGESPKEVIEAGQYAYGGGRFELFKVGQSNKTVYEYDINSAYPYAIAQLPNLKTGFWQWVEGPKQVVRYGVYRITWKHNPFVNGNLYRAHPFFHRDSKGQISFPTVNETWVWSPELKDVLKFPGLIIHEGWEYIEHDDDRPFAWVSESYAIRRRYKEEGNPAQLALKLQLNSIYGKLAQRVGWNEETNTAPKWHQLDWSGWVTSYCRSMVYQASLHAGNEIVAYETDALFTTKDVSKILTIGNELGDWGKTTYDDFIYLQSGCRFGLVDGKWQAKYRGFDAGSITVEAVRKALSKSVDEWKVQGTTSRFIGFAQALQTKMHRWRNFETDVNRYLSIGTTGKRVHKVEMCTACKDGKNGLEGFHDLVLTNPIGGQSEKHFLPWIDGKLLESQTATDEWKWEIE